VPAASRFDAIVVGGGHNALVAATLLGRAGRSVLVLERADRVGGAAVSEFAFRGVDARLSRFAYLVSLFPRGLLRELGVEVELRRRPEPMLGPEWDRLQVMLERLGQRVFPTLTEPLRSRSGFERLVGDRRVWEALFERPLSELLEGALGDDTVRGIALTDATIGTFAPADDPELRQNRCFLYHVIGGGWEVPVGGMGALSEALARAAAGTGAKIRTGADVVSVGIDGRDVEVDCADGQRFVGRHLLSGVAPSVLARLLGDGASEPAPEGAQLKLNMVLKRLPRLRDASVPPERAFAGTFHVNEGYEQLQSAYEQASAGAIPSVPPCELYCHTLTDASILSPDLRAAGAHTVTLFGLHMPARLFRADPEGAKRAAVEATLRSVNGVLAEPLEECLLLDADGGPCLEAHTPLDVEAELGMPGGHIFHRDLSWPFAELEEEVGRWGVETSYPNVWVCGSGARRGGCVSGIPGHNAARAVLGAG
jgi:phytoene dehydrogenase-like protein